MASLKRELAKVLQLVVGLRRGRTPGTDAKLDGMAARKPIARNNHLQEAMTLLIRNQAAFVEQIARNDQERLALKEWQYRTEEWQRKTEEWQRKAEARLENIEQRLAQIDESLVQLPKTLLQNLLEQLPKIIVQDVLEKLPKAVKKEIGFKP